MKNRKTLTEVEIVELPILPEGWKWAKLGEIAYINSGSTPKNLDKSENKGQFPFYKISDMNSEGNEIWMKNSNLYLSIHEKLLFKVKEEKKGTIIFPKRGGAILTNKKRRLSCNAAYDLNIMGVKEASNCISNEFLWYWFLKLDLRKLYDGSNVPQINNKDIEPLYFPLPPLPEQRAIVSKIEQLFSELDSGIANLRLAQEQLKVYRQAVLKKAFEGELTKEWRLLHNLPNGKTLTLEQTTIPKVGLRRGPFGSAIKKSFFVSKGCKVYEQGNAINNDPYRGHYYISDEKFIELKNFEVVHGDLLVSCSGVTLGRIVEIPEDAEKGVINQALLRIKLKRDLIDSHYFIHLFRSAEFQKMIFSKSQGTAMPNLIGIKDFKQISLFVPSLLEQHAIVEEIETRLSVCDKMAQDIDEALEKAEALRQSILKKAFEGKLLSERELAEVRMAEDWEPAEVLLERVRAERAGNGKR